MRHPSAIRSTAMFFVWSLMGSLAHGNTFTTDQCDTVISAETQAPMVLNEPISRTVYLPPPISGGEITCTVRTLEDGSQRLNITETVPDTHIRIIDYDVNGIEVSGLDEAGGMHPRGTCRAIAADDGRAHICAVDLAQGGGMMVRMQWSDTGDFVSNSLHLFPESLFRIAPRVGADEPPFAEVFFAADVGDRTVRLRLDRSDEALTLTPDDDGTMFQITDNARASNWIQAAVRGFSSVTIEIDVTLPAGGTRTHRHDISDRQVGTIMQELRILTNTQSFALSN